MQIALALGSGGARGYAHIGVINELTERGYQIVGVAGSSMGALVGGLHAAGKLDEFADWAGSLTQRAVLRLLDPSLNSPGVLRAGKILDAVRDILGDVTIEDLPIPYTSVATDLIAGWWRTDRLFCIAVAFLALVFAGTTVSGVIMLLQRRSISRYLLMAGALVAFLTYIGVFIAGARVAWVVHLLPILPIATVVLVLLPQTKRWLDA